MKINNRIFANHAFTAISLILFVASYFNCFGYVARAESAPKFVGAAPYTEEVVKKINAAYEQTSEPKMNPSATV